MYYEFTLLMLYIINLLGYVYIMLDSCACGTWEHAESERCRT